MNLINIDGVKYEDAAIGLSLERVLRYYTIRGKLTHVSIGSRVGISAGIHPGLKAFGVQKIEIDFDSEEVAFIFEGNHIIYFCTHVTLCYIMKKIMKKPKVCPLLLLF